MSKDFRAGINFGALEDTRSEFEKLGELHHSHLVGVTTPFDFKVIPQNEWKHYTQRNQDGSFSCTCFSSATVYEANEGVVVSAHPPYAKRGNAPQEGAIPEQNAIAWMVYGTTTEVLCPSDNLSETDMNVVFAGSTPLTIQNYVILDVKDINQLANAIQTYKAICIDLNVCWDEWNFEQGVPTYIPSAVVAGGHQMAGIQALEWSGNKAIMAQQSWGKDEDSIEKNGWVILTETFLKARGTGALAYIFRPATPNNPVVSLNRMVDNGVETLGGIIYNSFTANTLERPWKNNQHNISCVPKGSYHCVWSYMNNLGEHHYQLQNVPGRTGVFIHEGNYYTNSGGCILLGNSLGDINHDGQQDVLNSKVTLQKFETLMGEKPFTLIIR